MLIMFLSIFSQFSPLIYKYGYAGVFLVMILESASLPIPSEVILPLTGSLVAAGFFNFYLVLLIILAGEIIGMFIDYYVAYFLGKDVVYKHLDKLHIKRSTLDSFDSWFEKNGAFAVFIARLLPVVRGLISFPAGFAMMERKKFFLYSVAGSLFWDVVLMLFGYYALKSGSVYAAFTLIAILGIVLYLIYKAFLNRIGRDK
ncbi:MAG: DedA family protein [Candidatus Marsarchaeota archaeon]|jgi:membrane protein DedA with SNARE-associated domain|nr:DedA family protein [Candidatus Marsarchaeota archaeon]